MNKPRFVWTFIFAFLSSLVSASLALAGSAFKTTVEIKMADQAGKPCFLVMKNLLVPALNKDYQATFQLKDMNTVKADAQNFDQSVYKKVLRSFKDGEAGVTALVNALQGRDVTPKTLKGAIAHVLEEQKLLKDPKEIGLVATSIAPFFGIISGTGVKYVISSKNACCHWGYGTGENDRDEKTGRSFVETSDVKAIDPSDVYYLKTMGTYLSKTETLRVFYKTMLEILVKSDASGFSKLDADGETVLSHLLTVYQAEQRRHFMDPQLRAHPWENDLAEVTMVSAYGTKAGKVFLDGRLIDGTPDKYFGKSTRGGGTGIGITRKDRRELQRRLTAAVREEHPEVVSAVEKFTGAGPRGDLFQGYMEYLNNPQKQDEIIKNADNLVAAMTDFLVHVSENAEKLTHKLE